MANKRIPLESNKYYHIYDHSVGSDNLFRNDDNYFYFLKKYVQYLDPVFETYAYCLMPNHFHFLISVRSEDSLSNYFNSSKAKITGKQTDFCNSLSHQVGSFLNAYTKAYNKAFNRRGSLFVQSFNRKIVIEKNYFTNLIRYIHLNPVSHNFAKDIANWKYSSYNSILSDKETFIEKQRVIEWFESRDNFIEFHKGKSDSKMEF